MACPTAFVLCALQSRRPTTLPAGPHTISIPPGLYALTIPASGANDETTGDLNITANMSIIGAGSSTTIIDGNHNVIGDRVLRIGDIIVSISGVTIRNGNPGGNQLGKRGDGERGGQREHHCVSGHGERNTTGKYFSWSTNPANGQCISAIGSSTATTTENHRLKGDGFLSA